MPPFNSNKYDRGFADGYKSCKNETQSMTFEEYPRAEETTSATFLSGLAIGFFVGVLIGIFIMYCIKKWPALKNKIENEYIINWPTVAAFYYIYINRVHRITHHFQHLDEYPMDMI